MMTSVKLVLIQLSLAMKMTIKNKKASRKQPFIDSINAQQLQPKFQNPGKLPIPNRVQIQQKALQSHSNRFG